MGLILRIWGQGLGFGREEGNLGLRFRAASLPERSVMYKTQRLFALCCSLLLCIAHSRLALSLSPFFTAITLCCLLSPCITIVALHCSMPPCIAALALCCSLPPWIVAIHSHLALLMLALGCCYFLLLKMCCCCSPWVVVACCCSPWCCCRFVVHSSTHFTFLYAVARSHLALSCYSPCCY
jgi:hypothetical protein